MTAANDAEYRYDEADRLARDIAWSNRAIYLPPPERLDAHWWRWLTPLGLLVLTMAASVALGLALLFSAWAVQ